MDSVSKTSFQKLKQFVGYSKEPLTRSTAVTELNVKALEADLYSADSSITSTTGKTSHSSSTETLQYVESLTNIFSSSSSSSYIVVYPLPPPLEENMFKVFLQMLLPFLIAGFGTVGAGYVLSVIQHWEVYQNITELFILTTPLLGMKGNLEMCLASRLSTHSNLGNLDNRREKWRIIFGNLALEQCQSTILGFSAAILSVTLKAIQTREFNRVNFPIVCASSMATATCSSFLLGSLMCTVVLLSKKCHLNPDNIATPIAASVGDLICLLILSNISQGFYFSQESMYWLPLFLISVYVIILPMWIVLTLRNKYVRPILRSGWAPIAVALILSTGGGLILQVSASNNFVNLPQFQPIINGIGGNLVAIQSSRISTNLYRNASPGDLPKDHPGICVSPIFAFLSRDLHARTARLLVLMSFVGHLTFSLIVVIIKDTHDITILFCVVYIIASTLQVICLLYIAYILVHLLWKRNIDPDTASIPYLTALGDLLGTTFLFCVFIIVPV